MNNLQQMAMFRNPNLGYLQPQEYSMDLELDWSQPNTTTTSTQTSNMAIVNTADIKKIQDEDWYKKLSPSSKNEIDAFLYRKSQESTEGLNFMEKAARSMRNAKELLELRGRLEKKDAQAANQSKQITTVQQIQPVQTQAIQQVQQKSSTPPVVEEQWIKGLSNTQATLIGVGILAVAATVVVVAIN